MMKPDALLCLIASRFSNDPIRRGLDQALQQNQGAQQ
ncbi:hypothetical protein M2367_000553 [Aeromonas sp. BIGb0445]|jgi:hypothetical protein|nr:hypothetical protein [Aeromonas sp. BIGb0445]